MMFRTVAFLVFLVSALSNAQADVSEYIKYFKVDMQMELPTTAELFKNFNEINTQYNKGYVSRFEMDKQFKKKFSQTIKHYGTSESRIKNNYEDDLLEALSWLPKSMYQYIGPMLHEIPGMSEKILNMPGIKETKNQFPQDIDEKYQDIEGLENLSPALYILLMPHRKTTNVTDTDIPKHIPAQHPKTIKDIPDFLKEKVGMLIKKEPQQKVKKKIVEPTDKRTLFPTISSPLTTQDAKAVMASFDEINEWGQANNLENFSKLLTANMFLNLWEKETNQDKVQGSLKDIVNPCQRLVLKTRFAGLYNEFRQIVAKQGFNPEEWAYTCDKAIKALRVAEADHTVAYAVQFHRRGYYKQYINKLPQKWRNQMYATEAAIIAMYTVLKEDVEAIKPVKKEFLQKIIRNNGMLLTSPVFY